MAIQLGPGKDQEDKLYCVRVRTLTGRLDRDRVLLVYDEMQV